MCVCVISVSYSDFMSTSHIAQAENISDCALEPVYVNTHTHTHTTHTHIHTHTNMHTHAHFYRGGAWVVVDSCISTEGVIEMYADPTARCG